MIFLYFIIHILLQIGEGRNNHDNHDLTVILYYWIDLNTMFFIFIIFLQQWHSFLTRKIRWVSILTDIGPYKVSILDKIGSLFSSKWSLILIGHPGSFTNVPEFRALLQFLEHSTSSLWSILRMEIVFSKVLISDQSIEANNILQLLQIVVNFKVNFVSKTLCRTY